MRYVIEGEWSGYTRAQTKIVHREVTTLKYIAEWFEKNRCISFSDGTSLHLSVREAKPRERVPEIHGYDQLLDDCRRENVDSVNALVDRRKAKTLAYDLACINRNGPAVIEQLKKEQA